MVVVVAAAGREAHHGGGLAGRLAAAVSGLAALVRLEGDRLGVRDDQRGAPMVRLAIALVVRAALLGQELVASRVGADLGASLRQKLQRRLPALFLKERRHL